jgi:hypothetical protein
MGWGRDHRWVWIASYPLSLKRVEGVWEGVSEEARLMSGLSSLKKGRMMMKTISAFLRVRWAAPRPVGCDCLDGLVCPETCYLQALWYVCVILNVPMSMNQKHRIVNIASHIPRWTSYAPQTVNHDVRPDMLDGENRPACHSHYFSTPWLHRPTHLENAFPLSD